MPHIADEKFSAHVVQKPEYVGFFGVHTDFTCDFFGALRRHAAMISPKPRICGFGIFQKFFGFLPMNVMDGETYYASVKEAGYPATGAWDFRKLGYFAAPPKAWDKAALNTATTGRVNYDEKGYCVMLRPQAVSGGAQAGGYCTTDPRKWDTDGDGMDDYYELFHGLNPLLGDVSDGSLANDVIAQAYGGRVCSWYNAWTG